ncbi:MAG: hypothetical protein R2780_02200 [Crocinitomicaceae bacterium]|nr:hypothetical protein [Crocinitomicaceae bacterium]
MFDYISGHIMANPGLLVASLIVGFIALVSQMALYAKAGQSPWTALVPVLNVIVFCKVVGRPSRHALFLIVPGLVMLGATAAYWSVIDGLFPIHGLEGDMIPGPSSLSDATVPFVIIGLAAIPLAYIMVQMFAEVCDSFGKHKMIDKVLCVAFNGIYILFVLGISNTLYESGWYSRKRGRPYYMPDFKHKGKKFLVTPSKPVEKDGDWKKDEIKVKSVDKSDKSIYDGSDPGDGAEVTIEGTANFQKVVERKVLEFNEGQSSYAEKLEAIKEEQVEELKEELKSHETPKVEEKKEEVKTEAKKEEPKVEAKSSTDESDHSSGKLADTQKKFSKKANDGKSHDSSGKSWRDEMLEKYKKK